MIDSITGQDIQSALTVTVRMACAMAAGLAIGIEREQHYQPAGLRTHMALALGACLVMIISILIPVKFLGLFPGSDPTRISAQAISGIGFLGAGAIFRYGFNVKGLTTAASIWTTASIGLAFGAGLYYPGFLGTALLIIILQVFEFIENRFVERKDVRVLTVEFKSDSLDISTVTRAVKQNGVDIRQMSITELVNQKTTELKINCRIDESLVIRDLFDGIKSLGDIKTLRID